MVTDLRAPAATGRVSAAVAAAGVSSFALLYAPQAVLPQLAGAYELDPGSASLTVGVATTALALAVLPLAALSEVVDRRKIIIWSVIGSAVLGLLLPLAPDYRVLLAMRALQGVAIAGFPGVAAAYLADQVGAARLPAAVGAMIAGNSVGGMLGRLGAGFTAEPLGWQGALLVVAGVSLACAVFAAATLPRSARGGHAPGPGAHEPAGGWVRRLVVPYAVGALGMGAFVAVYNAAGFRLTAPPLDLAPAVASLVFLAYATGTVSSAAAGRLVDRLGRGPALVAALVTTAAGAALTLPDRLPVMAAGFAVLTAGFFAAHAVASAWVAAEAPPRARGRAAGLYTLCYYLGSGAGGTAGTAVYGHAGWTALVALIAGWLLLALIAVLAALRRSPSRNPRATSAL
ncbi:MFS transporter [Nonomuraea sp. SBT364]|uniref:MFS transporter n=1 Tax=Nonomuraea sp. SBT364 TaxID=1580530 RepID=UPI00066ED60C|nr:MFS transporter [Nonomuraea sp. SBT364]